MHVSASGRCSRPWSSRACPDHRLERAVDSLPAIGYNPAMDSTAGRFGFRIAIAIGAAIAAFTMASTAEAKPSAATKIVVYNNIQGPPPTALAFGRLASPKPACVINRKVKLVGKMPNGKTKSLDSGRSSAEGAVSAFYSTDAAENAKRLYLLAAKTKGCAKGKRRVPPPATVVPLKGNVVGSFVNIMNVDGKGPDGAFAGFVGLSAPAKCFADRKVVLSADGTVIDEGTTTEHGGWALHVTRDEFDSVATFRVQVKKDKVAQRHRLRGRQLDLRERGHRRADSASRHLSGAAPQRPRSRTPRSSQPRWWASSWRTVRSTCARSSSRSWPKSRFEGVPVDDDVVGVDVAGDGSADVVAVGVELVAAIGDRHRRRLEHLPELLRQIIQRLHHELVELTRRLIGGRQRGERVAARRPGAETRTPTSRCRPAPRSIQAVTKMIAAAQDHDRSAGRPAPSERRRPEQEPARCAGDEGGKGGRPQRWTEDLPHPVKIRAARSSAGSRPEREPARHSALIDPFSPRLNRRGSRDGRILCLQ